MAGTPDLDELYDASYRRLVGSSVLRVPGQEVGSGSNVLT